MIAAPVLFLMYDRWVDKRCPNWRLYAGYLASILFVMVTKHLALAGQGSDFVEPYLHSPLKPGFTSHVLLQFRSYAANLVLAQWTLPFESAEVIREVNSIWGLLILTGLLLGGTALLWKDGRFWFLLMLGGATWLPTSFVYLSERYLYLPSITFIGLMALLISSRTPPWRTALL